MFILGSFSIQELRAKALGGRLQEAKHNNKKRFRNSLILLWFPDLMNVTEEVAIYRPNVSTLLSSAFLRGDLNAAARGPFI